MTVRVVVADDQELVRAGIVAVLGTQPDLSVVAEACDGRAAVEATRAHRPDVVLMDVRMPRLDGIEATRQICQTTRLASRIIILTTFDLDEYVYAALRAGASGFLLKDAPREQLYHAVRTVAAGDALLAPSVTRRLIEQHVRGTVPAPDLSDMVTGLTDREREVLRLMAAGLSNAEIAARLFLGEATVRTHVGHIFAKTASRDRAQAIVFAYRSGLARPASP
jgi:DNA-binding NarL/FixJ family response regulator